MKITKVKQVHHDVELEFVTIDKLIECLENVKKYCKDAGNTIVCVGDYLSGDSSCYIRITPPDDEYGDDKYLLIEYDNYF